MGSYDETDSFYTREPIAIVGSSCRFPGGATSPSKLWELLKAPRDVVQEIPTSRFSTTAFYNANSQHHGKRQSANVKHAYLLDEDPRAFDRDFFSINPKESEAMDPQQRMLLETVYEGVESTGYSLQQLKGSSTAVFVGCMSYDYQFTAIRGIDSLPQYHGTGTAASILANRVSYFYDWRGPSVSIDTACSSSLVALHQAVSALRNGEAEMAVAAGSNLIIGPEPFVSESKGFSAIFLKTLSQAIADGDHIEAIIRETGVNSDGKTPGITMPDSESQARLIRETYVRAGLNLDRESDRPQYFEAHGTGTQAGDPIEARAISSVFFPNGREGQLLVGSIKTVIGHTEGTAGVAGVLKAALAVQHGQIPANLHFKNLNPKVRPYYANLRIPTETVEWPALPRGTPRRVSCNSFGFGGTNAHAIIESWDGPGSLRNSHPLNGTTPDVRISNAPGGGPFVLSANSGNALAAGAGALAGYLRQHPETDLAQLAHTLFRRTEFPFRAAFSATSAEQLAEKLEAGKDALKGSTRTANIPEVLPVRILGVFTGQGAQWATMGKELYIASDLFRNAIDQMQQSLDSLPANDRPDWTLVDQLNAPAKISRVGEAAVSQPLCTALQIALVHVLRAAGIDFSAVVGHSSGEIGAAYAAGYLNATDAIRVAYYRGVHSHLAHGPGGKRGKMMAVGMSLSQATTFCGEFGGRLAVAASNSQTSCTLAGDAEAIEEAHARLEEEGTFARILQVDTAYHSHHMKPCGTPYLESMKACGVKVQKRRNTQCRWYSSVFGPNGRIRSFDQADGHLLEGQYWVDNMTQAVLFSQALARALNEDQYFDLALEVGPHPALKGPSSETIKMLTGLSLPYSGVLKRGQNATESFADALGLLWKLFPSTNPIITFDGIRRAFPRGKSQQLSILKGLPAYSWDHPNLIWKESRTSRIFRTRKESRHELLGHSDTHGERDKREVHWKQLIRVNELPWLAGHKIQGEILFPASGYLAMTYEAAIRLVDDQQSLRLVELHDVDIMRAMRLEEDSPGLEVVFTIRVLSQSDDGITAEVACYSGAVDSVQPLDAPQARLTTHFTAGVRISLGEPHKDALPRRAEPRLPLDALDIDQLYESLAKVGYNYADPFRAKSVSRRLNSAAMTVSPPPTGSSIRASMHPAPLDTTIHGLLAGFSFPGDGRLQTIYLPRRIDCVRISMMTSESTDSILTVDARVTSANETSLSGDVDICNAGDASTEVQIRGLHVTAVGQRQQPWLYAGTAWARDARFGIEPGHGAKLSEAEQELYEQLTRTAHFYLRQLKKKILPQELMLMGKFRKHMMTWVLEHLLPQIDAGQHPEVRPEWANDTMQMLNEWRAAHSPTNNDMNILHAMGKNLVGIVRGTTPPLKVLTQDGMLDRLYVEGLGAKDGNVDIEAMVKQLSHQYPRMRIVEVGAGTGGTTRAVLDGLENRYASYTYTDISTGFFENARTVFSQQGSKLAFKTLNIENDPADQGFTPGTFDMVVSSNCLHATRSLDETLRHCRQLLRPGGRLMLLEITRDFLPTQLVMSTLPGWFLGIEDGRVWAPTVSLERWDELLKANGFSGVDISSTPSFCSVIVAQAVDETVQLLREPLAVAPEGLPPLGDVLIIGDSASSDLGSKTQAMIKAVAPSSTITMFPKLEGIEVPKGAAVLCLADLESPVFRGMTEKRFTGLQEVMGTAEVVLWVTTGAKSGKNPDANTTVGLSSTLRAERMDLRLQFLDVDDPSSIEPSMLAEMFLRLAFQDPAKNDELLWTQEPELVLKQGALYIPRVIPRDSTNRRSAARLRQVTQTTSLKSKGTAVVLGERQEAFELQAATISGVEADKIRLQVTASSLHTLTCEGYGPLYVCIGSDVASGDKILGLSSLNSSFVDVAADRVLYRWQQKKPTVDDTAQLGHFLANILAEHLLGGLQGPVWVHGAPSDLSEAIDAGARRRGVYVFQTTSELTTSPDVNFLHPYASEDDIQDVQPKGLHGFVNLAHPQHETLSAFIRASLPASAIMNKKVEDLTVGLSLPLLISLANEHLRGGSQLHKEHHGVVGVDKLPAVRSKELGLAAVVDWSTADTVSALVRPLEHRGLFAANKTYLLCGMTGDLGISVCLWMVDNGARNVVLTSRKPNVSESVLNYLSRKGATVRPMAVDISNKDSVRAAYSKIKATMPPIGGVMNAAMVLRDRLFHRMPWDDFAAVLGPKMVGSANLDEVFGDEQLDFFICFSSTTSIVGSIGQSAYAAANHYMASLVERRQARGLAGSVLHIAILTGFGYIFRRDSDHAETIYKAILPRFNRESESDLHEMLAEAIIGGRPGSGEAELITGIRPVFQGEWRDDPRLSCYVGQEQVDESSEAQADGSVSVKDQLTATEDPAESLAVLEKCFGLALGNLLEIDPEKLDNSLPVTSLGIDSLVAIRIREWFLRETGVDVPVLKLMSDTYSISRMCDDVLVDWRKNNKS
ncbi:Polyketide synthase 19 [Didymosphaeria variabile]|uniref:Polyketide synthase 19 n=1 Tax=Didymosphaeria variabile TaxID=1932322 RepID=A0A9W9CA18_9PLEO|nr:Polyketide synthase 19 [Didymosphaeria variabile]KAJ4351221.1 Polyketide synthase 19 [Didymosphaeria variabile]